MMASSNISGVSSSVSLIGPPGGSQVNNKLKMETFRSMKHQPSASDAAVVAAGGGTLPGLSRPGILKQPGKMRPISPPAMFVQHSAAASADPSSCATADHCKPVGFNSNCQQCVAERVAVLSRPVSPSSSDKGGPLAISQSAHSIHQPQTSRMVQPKHSAINPNLR